MDTDDSDIHFCRKFNDRVWIKTYMETKLSYFVFQYPLIWLVVGLCCLAGISFAVPAGLYMLEKGHCEQYQKRKENLHV